MSLNVLIYGGGAREHALAWKISQSKLLSKLYLYVPNDGFSNLGEVITAKDHTELAKQSKELDIDLLIVGPEQPLVDGIVDIFESQSIPCIGANKLWAKLEGSKSFAKEFMQRNNIPTAEYNKFDNLNNALEFIKNCRFPIVIKADGLAAGKGVIISENETNAKNTLKEFFNGKYAEASQKLIIEEFLEGEELSLISIWDGKTLLPFIPARDYKKLLNNDKGPNTGGMGAYCPVKLSDNESNELNRYIKALETALTKEQADFKGIIYSGLMLTKNGIKVLEYNMRFGDPETQPLLMNMKSDLLELFIATAKKELDKYKIEWNENPSGCVVIAANGYPESPLKGSEIKIPDINDIQIFYAGIKIENNKLFANGGRVLSICRTAKNPFNDIYNAANNIDFNDKYYRTDIGVELCKN